ncbi:50S ribosomal protein L6 [Buchnera aphidicola]|uniref:50S ribosomal protein L6 n=1 Tax=Buchnera aphidicola (Cinara cf. splendens/pseudotsugae 3390) TaxID=2518980 RepID=A0A451CXP9_9GAMM|nr:50S ribosomal protein L6 [Buchnera aphidicola]VFP77904.1 50S ribosomal protein L6 [Buchnera aphidicola (Cinara cf. splendens/pseudotsugae 3390)]
MSRVAKSSIIIPNNVAVDLSNYKITVNGPLGSLTRIIHVCVKILKKDGSLFFSHNHLSKSYGWMQAGTCRSLVHSMILGVTEGFIKQLNLFGVGYRVILENENILKLYLGFSHPVIYKIPQIVTVSIISQNEIVLKSIDKQLVGQVAANIRLYRVPEPYKGKGIRYLHEIIRIKEAKKK